MPNPTLFSFEAPVLDALRAIPGVHVLTTASDADIQNLSTVKPTLVVRWAADASKKSTETTVLVERTLSVYLLIAGATTDTDEQDGQLGHQVFDALHGLALPGHNLPLSYDGGEGSMEDGIRTYMLTFKTQATLRAREK